MSVSSRKRFLAVAVAVGVVLASAGCVSSGAAPETVAPTTVPILTDLGTYPNIDVVENVAYGQAGPTTLFLDVCLPDISPLADRSDVAESRAAVMIVHGGSWKRGDKSDLNWRTVCEWVASEGFVAFSINYRLAPEFTFPAQLDDLREAIEWIRDDAQTSLFGVDPLRVGALGGSAGGNLVSLLATTGDGRLDAGSRVAAVVDLSGPADLTDSGRRLGGLTEQFEQIQLDYLGCAALASCPGATAASPIYHVDAGDPPFFVGHSTDELIPLQQSEAFVVALEDAGVDVTFVTVEGTRHSIAMLDAQVRDRVAQFLRRTLGDDGAVG
jgi:acetyl esterase/lipase